MTAVVALVLGVLTAVPATANMPVAADAASVSSSLSDTALGGPVKIADLSKFQPGNIISDAVFFNSGTMTEAQIQTFLQTKMPTCRAGYTCLKDWYDNTSVTAADAMCAAYPGGERERASRIIYKVAQACGINPQVLLVMLQKEQGLILGSAPSAWNYQAAMGQGCPDTASCDPRYDGFFKQVRGAAWQLKRYANPPGTTKVFTWYAPGNTWNVRYSPDATCGSSPVYIQNQATANLYYYTPYQPNAASLAAGYNASSDKCASYGNRNFYQFFTDWFGSTQQAANSPFGNIELVQPLPGEFRVAGWAADLDTRDPLSIHVNVGGSSAAFTANLERADVGAAYPAVGSAHGFDVKVPAIGAGTVNVCVYAINVGRGSNVLLGCASSLSMSGSPVGALDAAKPVEGGVELSGWAIDPDTAGPTSVHLYVGSVGSAVNADRPRSELATNYPAYGVNHGFTARLSAAPGQHSVCAYAINSGPGGTTVLGCQSVTVPGSVDLGRAPFGNFESLTVNGNIATAAGWSIDPDTTAPIKIHLYAGSTGTEYTADKTRPDVAAAYPASGANHGFGESLTLLPGTTQVCAYAINTGAGGHTFLGCRSATVVSTAPDRGRPPFGNFEGVSPVAGGATVSGWALDPDTTAPIKIHIYAGAVGAEYSADKPRDDVGNAYGLGSNHGFNEFISLPPGQTNVCVYAINTGAGGHTFVGCRTVVVP